jgi:glycosyltransferase involved in cell wall biosynthesis
MAGEGDLKKKMIDRAAELNLSEHFEFPGFIEDHAVFDLLASGDVFVMPSVSEPFGIVALEAMHAAVPGVVSKQSGASEILRNVFKVDYWNVQEMAEIVLKILNDVPLRNKLRKAAKREVEKLTWENSAFEIRRIYLNLLKNYRT